MIDGDLPCIQCGYNLRSLSRAGNCPECGFPVEETFQKAHIEFDVDRLSDLRRAVTALAWSGLASLASCAGIAIFVAFGALDYFAFLLYPVLTIVFMAVSHPLWAHDFVTMEQLGYPPGLRKPRGRLPEVFLAALLVIMPPLCTLGLSLFIWIWVPAIPIFVPVWTWIWIAPHARRLGLRFHRPALALLARTVSAFAWFTLVAHTLLVLSIAPSANRFSSRTFSFAASWTWPDVIVLFLAVPAFLVRSVLAVVLMFRLRRLLGQSLGKLSAGEGSTRRDR